jgi:L-ribulose-5-phosphate 3-epimerase
VRRSKGIPVTGGATELAATAAATGTGRIAVCSWSLQPATTTELVERVHATGVTGVQLALDPVRTGVMPLPEVQAAAAAASLTLVSGMMAMAGEDYTTLESIRRTGGVVPDEAWPHNEAAARENAVIARQLGIGLVTFHAGFLPHDRRSSRRAVLLDRIRVMAAIFRDQGVAIALETGQESAATLLQALEDLAGEDVGVNFDPANMILYGMGDPVDALTRLAPAVRQLHVKDALPAAEAGEWGTEVRVGSGAVDWDAFLDVVREGVPAANLVIERESGTDRVGDVRAARDLLLRGGFGGAG